MTVLYALLSVGGGALAAGNREETPTPAQETTAQGGQVEIDPGSGSYRVYATAVQLDARAREFDVERLPERS